jgi:flagellar basal-body rod modification protein FlgD
MGKSVKVEGNSVEIGEKNGTDLIFELESDAMSVNINIFDKYGSLMKIIECGSMGSGSNNIYWDGTNYNGEQVSDGTYTFNVNAVDFEGNSIATNTFTKSGIESVVFKDGIPYLVTRESEFPIGDVIEIFENENNQE